MNLISYEQLRLFGRNEGKIKSYESCFDISAWSHDLGKRDQYLRRWIKCDMPVNIISVCPLTRILTVMTCKSRIKPTPRCHPDCKSQLLLNTISNSCSTMRECLKENKKFEKYFQEEEFETSNWPCERCLDALKGVKMLWKIVVEKLFNINISKREETLRAHTVHSLAKNWQKEITQEAVLVKNMALRVKREANGRKDGWRHVKLVHSPNSLRHGEALGTITVGDNAFLQGNFEENVKHATKLRYLRQHQKHDSSKLRNLSKSIVVKVSTVDVGCETCSCHNMQRELIVCQNNLQSLQEQYTMQLEQINVLREENFIIKAQLNKATKQRRRKPLPHESTIKGFDDIVFTIPKPYDIHSDASDKAKSIDSETIITMKSCENDTFKHVSLLQVLHKTNGPFTDNIFQKGDDNFSSNNRNEDPVALLNKVHETFGAIVKKEVNISNEKNKMKNPSDINATYQKLIMSKSTMSHSTLSSFSHSSIRNFVSAKEESDVH